MLKKNALRSAMLAAFCAASFNAPAMADAATDINIPAGSLAEALEALAKHYGLFVLYESAQLEGLTTVGVSGQFESKEAFQKLIEGTPLVMKKEGDGIVISRPQQRIGAAGVDYERANVTGSTQVNDLRSVSTLNRLVLAQAAGESPLSGEGSSEKHGEFSKLEEIVVTATKREEPLQDIPLSVTVLDEQTLIKQGVTELTDYARRIPNLAFAATGGSALGFFSMQMRGVGGGSTTGFYIDDVPIFEGMNPRVMDIARIEVLRGPQGSLYGTRSMGGTVRLITKRADPTATEFQIHASLDAVTEGDQNYAVDSAFNLPIASNLAFRGNLYYQRETGVHDVVVDNPTVVGDEVTYENADDGEYWGAQAMLTWNPIENLTVEPRFMYQNSHVDWAPFSDLRPGNFIQRRASNRADPSDEEWSISSLTVSWDMDWGRFSSATAFFNKENSSYEELSEFMNYYAGFFGLTTNYYPLGGALYGGTSESRQLTEEARFTSAFDGPLQLTAGVFYSKNKGEGHNPCNVALGLNVSLGWNEATGSDINPECIFVWGSQSETKETAVFGELEYALLDDVFLTLGGRYFENSTAGSNEFSGIYAGTSDTISGPVVKHSENGFNPKVALKWEVSPDWTLYSSAGKGYRIGGQNGAVPPGCAEDLAAIGYSAAPASFESDSLWSYEVGSKSAHADRRFTLNAAAFFIDWSGMIQGVFLPNCVSGFTDNVGKAEVKGGEVEIAGRAADRLQYALGIGYADSKISDPQYASFIAKGDPIPNVPKWTLNGNVDYRFNLGAREGYFFVDYSWVSRSISGRRRDRDGYGVLGARLGTTFGKWDIALSGKNLLNKHANLSDNAGIGDEVAGRFRYVTNRPRTLGVDFRWTF